MTKKVLYEILITSDGPINPRCAVITAIVLLLSSLMIWSLWPSLPTLVLYDTVRIFVWASTAWIWADILWLSKYSWLRDRRKYPW